MSAQPAAAWYPDPTNPVQLRWWDGVAWTDHVHAPVVPAGERPVEPVGSVYARILNDPAQWVLFPDHAAGFVPAGTLADDELVKGMREKRRRIALVGGGSVLAFVILPGWLAIVAVIGVIVYLARTYGIGRNAAGCGDGEWASRRGMTRHDDVEDGTQGKFFGLSSTKPDLAPYVAVVEPLRRVGFRASVSGGTSLHGRPWAAAGPSTIADVRYEHGDNEGTLSVVSIELPDDVARRYVGVCVEIVPDDLIGRMMQKSVQVVRPGKWRRVQFENKDVRVHVSPDQQELALWELVDTTLLEQLVRRGPNIAPAGFGLVVVEARLIAWRCGGMLGSGMAWMGAGTADQADRELETWLDTVRSVHRRLYSEWQ